MPDYTFTLLNPASTTADLPQNLGAVAASTTGSLWPVVVIIAGIALGLGILTWVIARFRSRKSA